MVVIHSVLLTELKLSAVVGSSLTNSANRGCVITFIMSFKKLTNKNKLHFQQDDFSLRLWHGGQHVMFFKD